MQHTPIVTRLAHAVQRHRKHRVTWCLGLLLGLGSLVSCGTEAKPPAPAEQPVSQTAPVESDNGLSVNGLSVNGLSFNGLSVNGLSVNGLASTAFKNWFEASPALDAIVMQYVVRCAVPAGQSRTYKSAVTGVTYTWPGALGLAPGWAGGTSSTVSEQQVISACLAAHANKYGMHIPLSVKGLDGRGNPIPYTTQELTTYTENEACFFGNLFNSEGVFAASDRTMTAGESTSRACALSTASGTSECPPITQVGSCSQYCTKGSSSYYYTQCTYRGVTYKPLTTKLRMQDIYRCGDGTCQFTESCGNSTQYNNCMPDCGFCK
jgi:hypothetical protein